MWTCPICTLHCGEPKKMTDVPYRHGEPEGKKNQGTDHLHSKGHRQRRRMFAAHLCTRNGTEAFFDIIGRSIPNFDATSPVDAIKLYIEECGGDGDQTILKLTPEPTPPPHAPWFRPSAVVVKTEIRSPNYATQVTPSEIRRTQLMCCWADSRWAVSYTHLTLPTKRIV